MSNIEETLKNILVQDLLSKHPAFGQIKIDTSSIVIKRDLEHTYHSESFVKEAMNESMAVNHPKTPPSQNGKDKTLQTRVGVVRKTTVKPNQPAKKKDPDEPEIDTENIPVVQGSFQITKTEADITENKQSSSPSRHDDKSSHKPSTAHKNTSTRISTLKPATTRPTTTKRVPTSTPKTRPFTITSTLNVKPRTEPTTRKENVKVSTSTTTTSTASTTTTVESTTANVSQILLDLLTNENHYKDLPKIDTLFTVPHVVDNEPWRPITRPYYESTSKTTPIVDEVLSDKNAEDRIGVAEVVEDDISVLEGMLTPIPPVQHKEKTTKRPVGIYNMDPNLAAQVYVPSPVYTSFTLPTFASPIKNTETLGSNYPKPHPIPVDKISAVVEVPLDKPLSLDEDDGKPVERPPKEKTTSVSLNVMQLDQQDNSTEKVAVEGASILKKQNTTTESPESSTTFSTTAVTDSSTDLNMNNDTLTTPSQLQLSSTEIIEEEHKDTSKENSTKRPNNKVSIIPSTSAPHHTWELVNTSTNNNDTFNKNSPEKYYNDTLQAIITKNDAVFPNTTPKFNNKVSILKNLTEIIKRYSHNTDKPPKEKQKLEGEERHNYNKMGSVEVVSDEDMETTTAAIITLLPAKSNLGVNRPLRPRPKIELKSQALKENERGFLSNDPETQKIIENLSTENYIPTHNFTNRSIENSEIVTSSSIVENEDPSDQMFLANVSDSIKVDSSEMSPTSNRLPKSSDELNDPHKDSLTAENTQIINVTVLPEGTYRVSYHVTGSVSSKQANKTQSLPAYELPLEPDVVLEIPVNHTNTLTIEKLKQLASLATISDSNNNTLFRAPGGVISTKAIPSSYTLNQAGFKILTKTYNKIPTKQEENSLDKPDKTYSKPFVKPVKEMEKDIVKEIVKEGKSRNSLYQLLVKYIEGNFVESVLFLDECNNATSFRCLTGACLPITSRCNRLLDCSGGEDEKACSCADYLRAEFSQSKICDGVVDCWDYSDENKCGMVENIVDQK